MLSPTFRSDAPRRLQAACPAFSIRIGLALVPVAETYPFCNETCEESITCCHLKKPAKTPKRPIDVVI